MHSRLGFQGEKNHIYQIYNIISNYFIFMERVWWFVCFLCWHRQREVLKKRLEEFSVSHPDVQNIKILLAGQITAGKSSFINSVNNVFRGRITSDALVDQSSGKSFTKSVSIIFK